VIIRVRFLAILLIILCLLASQNCSADELVLQGLMLDCLILFSLVLLLIVMVIDFDITDFIFPPTPFGVAKTGF